MKKLIATLVFTLFILIISTCAFATRGLTIVSDLDHKNDKIGTFYALIIGIQNYHAPEIPDLETPLKDAVDMADILKRKYGFTVELLLNNQATRRGIDSALRKLVALAKPEDNVLIYYAGHGDLDRQYNDGWWIPYDAQAGVSVTYVDNVQIQKAMRNIKARHVLLISDSCYSGTLFGQARAMPSLITDKYYLNLYNEKSRWGMTSGNKTPVSDSGTDGHSIFAYQLIKKLEKNEKPFISTQEIYIAIAPIVANNSEQTPLCRPVKGTGDQGGEFIFLSTEKPVSSKQKPSDSADDNIAAERKKLELELEKLKLEIERSKIEQEKRELEKLKAQMENQKLEPVEKVQEQKKIDEPNTKLTQLIPEEKTIQNQEEETVPNKPVKSQSTNPISPADKNIKIIAKDGHYIKYTNGIVYDEKTGLEWFAGPDSYVGRYKAERWVKELKLDGGNWRMPEKDELDSLYKTGSRTRNMTSLIETTGKYVWYKESFLNFYTLSDGSIKGDRNIGSSCLALCHRAFAVRSIK